MHVDCVYKWLWDCMLIMIRISILINDDYMCDWVLFLLNVHRLHVLVLIQDDCMHVFEGEQDRISCSCCCPSRVIDRTNGDDLMLGQMHVVECHD